MLVIFMDFQNQGDTFVAPYTKLVFKKIRETKC